MTKRIGRRPSENTATHPASRSQSTSDRLLNIFRRLFDHFGDLGWWPADTEVEVIIGAILVQSVSWKNTERALQALREHGLLDFQRISTADDALLHACLKPTRFFTAKTKKLKAFSDHVMSQYEGTLESMWDQEMESLREELLGIHGIGPETADDILLYAAGKPSFVVDAYTRRIFFRLGDVEESIGYEPLRKWFMNHLPHEPELFNHYHALIDAVGHHYCLARTPLCSQCPLQATCRFAHASP